MPWQPVVINVIYVCLLWALRDDDADLSVNEHAGQTTNFDDELSFEDSGLGSLAVVSSGWSQLSRNEKTARW